MPVQCMEFITSNQKFRRMHLEFSRGIVNEGLSIAIPNHISEMQYLIMLYTNLKIRTEIYC